MTMSCRESFNSCRSSPSRRLPGFVRGGTEWNLCPRRTQLSMFHIGARPTKICCFIFTILAKVETDRLGPRLNSWSYVFFQLICLSCQVEVIKLEHCKSLTDQALKCISEEAPACEELYLYEVYNITDASLVFISNMHHLRVLTLHSNLVTDDGLVSACL